MNRMYLDAMEAKHTLSARSRAVMQVNYQGRFAEIAFSREQFEELSADLLERTSYTSRQLLGTAGLEWKDVQRILLVGGSSRMPMVARMLQALSGIQPDRTVNPDEAVARGAALYAGHLLADAGGRVATDVPGHQRQRPQPGRGRHRHRHSPQEKRRAHSPQPPLPARHTERFATKSEGQRSIVIKVLEGESLQPGDCIAIGRTVVRDLPVGLPKGWPVEVTFEYGTNGRLAVEALVPGTQHQARLELVRDVGLSNEGLSRWKQLVGDAGGFDTFESAARSSCTRAAIARGLAQWNRAGDWLGAHESRRRRRGNSPLPSAPLAVEAVSPAPVAAPPTPLAVSPAAEQRWVSSPQPLTGSFPLAYRRGARPG